MWQFAKELLGRFPAVAAKWSWRIFVAIATVLGFLEIVNKSAQRQVLDTPTWTLIALACAVLVYTVFATAYEEWKDRTDSGTGEANKEAFEAAKASADAIEVSASAYKSGQNTIDALRTDLKEANDKLTLCMEESAALREEIGRLRSRDDS